MAETPDSTCASSAANTASKTDDTDTASFTHATAQWRHLRFDPRTKLYLVLLSSLLLFFRVHSQVEAVMMVFLLLPYFLTGHPRFGASLLALYFALLAIDWWVIPHTSGFVLSFLMIAPVTIRMLMPSVVAGLYAFTTTSMGEFVCACRRMHVPESITITFMVMIRFFPTIGEDYRQIRDAMKLRGIASGVLGMLRRPARSLEYVLMPLLMNSNVVAQDLTVAALTKGIGLPGEHTSLVDIRLTAFDWGYMSLTTVVLATGVGGLW